MEYEYKVIPAPNKGQKAKGVRSSENRFAHALELRMNLLAADGWEYVRSDTLPSEERVGLTQSRTVWRNLLVFRRPKLAALETQETPRLIAPPETEADQPQPPAQLQSVKADARAAPATTDPQPDSAPARAPLAKGEDPDDAFDALPGPLRARALRLRMVQGDKAS